ncbi:MAG TPA: DUF2182 domain-containing protein [Chloroflexota bacterium]|nr:DUF2182 domain-containing protein [Chloroflexota bacterium]
MIGLLRTPEDRHWYRLSIIGLIAVTWIALAVWGVSPYGWMLDHDSIAAGELPVYLGLPIFVVGWTLMTIAMMLPGSLPLINLFRRMVASRVDRNGLMIRLLFGYLGVWSVFSGLVYLGDFGLHRLVDSSNAISDAAADGWIAAIVVLLAGIYQFTPLKEMCLKECRSPYSFLAGHWRGMDQARDAFCLGIRHGLFCLGCCWSLMLLMIALVAGVNLAWMLALGTAMAIERNTLQGRRLTRPLGVLLLAYAAVLLLVPMLR